MSIPSASDILDDDAPLWLINEQIKGLLEGDGAGEDHQDVLDFLRRTTGLPEGTILRIHRAIVHGDTKVLPEQNCTPGVTAIANERRRQVEAEGWTPEHDDGHGAHELAEAAACYCLSSAEKPFDYFETMWPWDPHWFKTSSRRRDLIKAGALILAEIERLDRMAAEKKEGE